MGTDANARVGMGIKVDFPKLLKLYRPTLEKHLKADMEENGDLEDLSEYTDEELRYEFDEIASDLLDKAGWLLITNGDHRVHSVHDQGVEALLMRKGLCDLYSSWGPVQALNVDFDETKIIEANNLIALSLKRQPGLEKCFKDKEVKLYIVTYLG